MKTTYQERLARIKQVATTMVRAENTRCACGAHGSWDDTVSGTSGDRPCVWAGCPNCAGTAVGVPVLTIDLRYANRYPADLARERKIAAAVYAAEKHVAGRGITGRPCTLGPAVADRWPGREGEFTFDILAASWGKIGKLRVNADGEVKESF
jgi:hypothetical protein